MFKYFPHFPAPVDVPNQKDLQYIKENLWTCCVQYTVSSDSDLLLLQLTLKIYSCPWCSQSQANYGNLICFTFGCRSEFPFSSLVTQSVELNFSFGPVSACRSTCGVFPYTDTGGERNSLLGLTAQSSWGEQVVWDTESGGVGSACCDWDLWEVSTVWSRSCVSPGVVDPSHGCFSRAKLHTLLGRCGQ